MRKMRWRSRGRKKLIEMTLTSAVLVTLVAVVVQLALRSSYTSTYNASLDRAGTINQEILQRLRSDLVSSVKLFQNDPMGRAYLGVLDMSDATRAIVSVLPTINPSGLFSPESATAKFTGNTVLFAKYAWTDEYECRSGNRYILEVYRLVRNYLAEAGGGPGSTSRDGLNFCRWVSEPMVDGNQIDQIAVATDRAEILEHLLNATPDVNGGTHARVELVWRPGGHPALPGTLRQIGVGGFLSNSPLPLRNPDWKILRDPGQSSNGMLDDRQFCVASNRAHSYLGVGSYSAPNTGNGFEVQIIGRSGARRILVQLVVVSTHRRGLPAFSSLRMVASTREI